jgi:dynein heavy chain
MLGETLLQPSIRDRHWRELRIEVKEDFDETSEDFTLEKVLSLNLLSHSIMIFEIGDNANKQLKIEKDLNEIKFIWLDSEKSDLYITKEKSKADNEDYFMIKGTDNIMEHIENHSGLLGTHKSSPFYKEFDTEIDHWESTISQITETLEILMQVQSKWKYLESIFKGQPDISKQLPNEDSIFKRNN